MAGRFDSTSYGGPDSRFQTTEWSKVMNAKLGSSILTELYTKYWRPVYSYLRHKGFSNEDAKDIIQGFFSEKVLGQQLLQKADRNKGKFRTFLLTSLKNYATDLYRKQKFTQELDDQTEKTFQITNPEIEFDFVWAQELLQSVLKELETECRIRNKNIHWQVFREWLIESDPNNDNLDMGRICDKYSIKDTTTAYNMVSNLKGRFQKILRRRIRLHVDSDAQVDDEIRYFVNIFSKSSTRYK
jgi:hypothetical protein